jgi:hypothetical protein
VSILSGAFSRPEPALVPAQLPHRAGEQWPALAFPAAPIIDGERLLYTVHLAAPFVSGAPVCGLLVDEWSEVVPGEEAITGIVFHHDRTPRRPRPCSS